MDSEKHDVIIKNREWISVNGIKHVDNYDDRQIIVQTAIGILQIQGEDLNIKGLNLDEGTLEVTGYVKSMVYVEEQGVKTKNILKRLLK
jgi:sporulation protein YabP